MSTLIELSGWNTNINSTIISDDIDKRFHKTLLLGNIKGNESIFYIDRFRTDAPDQITVYDMADGNKEYRVKINEDHNWRIYMPKVGYYNVNGSLYYLAKIPAKQFKRSFSPSIYKMMAPILMEPSLSPQLMDNTVVNAIYKPVYGNINEIRESYFNILAFSRDFAATKQRSKVVLLYRKLIIATINTNKKEICANSKLFVQEISDFLRETDNMHWKITHESA